MKKNSLIGLCVITFTSCLNKQKVSEMKVRQITEEQPSETFIYRQLPIPNGTTKTVKIRKCQIEKKKKKYKELLFPILEQVSMEDDSKNNHYKKLLV